MATNEYVKYNIYLVHWAADIDIIDITSPTVVYNDNTSCCNWAKTTITKGLKHLIIWENFVHKCQQEYCIVQIEHISGKINCADIFTK